MPSKDMLPNSYQLKLQLVLTAQTSQLLLPPDMHSVVTASQLLCQACCYQTHRSSWPGYSSSQKSASTCALLYIAAFCCTPDCHGIMSQLITGNYVIKFVRNSFRVQLSARGIATCFASAQPKAQVSGGVDCLPSKSNSNHSGKFSGTSKLLVFCENALANSTLLCCTNWILQKKAGLFLQTALPS